MDISGALVEGDGDSTRSDSETPSLVSDDVKLSQNGEKARVSQSRNNVNLDFPHGVKDDVENDDEFITAQLAASNRKTSNKPKSGKKSGGFQSLGLSAILLKAITRKGFSVPTPIQRKTLPLILDRQDVVGMARTGSGKTAAFVIPMIERLKAHKVQVGTRAIVMSPSRELALQSLKAVKEFGRGTDLRTLLIVGGDSLEDQFGQMTSNPDIIIATPGRFLHLLVEMSLDLSSVQYMVFDEADRLFEMGFQAQLTEILHALPASRQTMLFSATLPKSLVEFARAGLKDPQLVRLDTETKISPDLESAFLTVKSADKDATLLYILSHAIKMRQPSNGASKQLLSSNKRKRSREDGPHSGSLDPPTANSTIVFAASQKQVEYLTSLLISCGYAVSFVYGNLDQSARKQQIENFREGRTTILVVTDVAARGIDIPMLANVINYDFPAQPKIFVHRVGRTARAGRKGFNYNIIENGDLPYLLDLQLFLGRKLATSLDEPRPNSLATDIVVGSCPRSGIEPSSEYIAKLLEADGDLSMQRTVANRAKKQYLRTRSSASAESARRAKELAAAKELQEVHLIFHQGEKHGSTGTARDDLLARISGFRPTETVFEIGRRGEETEATEALRRQRSRLHQRNHQGRIQGRQELQSISTDLPNSKASGARLLRSAPKPAETYSSEDEDEDDLRSSASDSRMLTSGKWHDTENFMSYEPRESNLFEDRGYGVQSGASQPNFVDAARGATMELANDEIANKFGEPSRVRWDKRSKKYVSRANDEDGSKGQKTITGESGQKLAASFRSGRFDAWKKAHRVDRLARPGEKETPSIIHDTHNGRRFRHSSEKAPKQPDKYRDDFWKKQRRRRMAEQPTANISRGHSGRPAKSELHSVEDIRQQRVTKQKRKEKNARPSRKARK